MRMFGNAIQAAEKRRIAKLPYKTSNPVYILGFMMKIIARNRVKTHAGRVQAAIVMYGIPVHEVGT